MIILVGAILISLMAAGGAQAQSLFLEPDLVLYGGGSSSQADITLGNWGGGICKETAQNTYTGSRSIEITPKGLYQGGRLDFAEPLDMTTWFNDPSSYLQAVVRFRGVQAPYDPWAVGVTTQPTTDIYGKSSGTGEPVRKVQVMLFLENGKTTECQVDVSSFRLAEDGWMTMSFPFAALKGKLSLASYKLSRLAITGDGTEPFHVGELRLVRDNTPLQAYAGEEKETGRYYSVVFRAEATTGASAVKYSWDFDNSDGIQEQAVGELVSHRFPKSGNFVVTLTVSDVFGLKKPATSTVNVKIND